MTPLETIAHGAQLRAEGEAILKEWIPEAYRLGIPIARIAHAAGISRASVYGRLGHAEGAQGHGHDLF